MCCTRKKIAAIHAERLQKDYAERLSQETKKMTDSIINTNNKKISEIDQFLGKFQSVFISTADNVLKRICAIK